jgi:hypothetical protein
VQQENKTKGHVRKLRQYMTTTMMMTMMMVVVVVIKIISQYEFQNCNKCKNSYFKSSIMQQNEFLQYY